MSKRDHLTERERQILALLAEGKTNIDIAGALGMAVNTVSVHVQSLYTKTDTESRVALARWYLQQTGATA